MTTEKTDKKTDKQLLKIFEDKEKSYKDFWVFERLTHEEKIRIFDLITGIKGLKKC